ncbi:MAG: hypothetical protein R3344_10970, partial [Acidobacteriota bacterium]|nr:hypothetical protein [Acidobacteriota bacterium]
FGPNYTATAVLTVPDFSGNGVWEIVAVGVHDTTGEAVVRVKDARTGNLLTEIALGDEYPPTFVRAVPHYAGSPAQEIAVLGIGRTTRRILATIIDTGTGEKLGDVAFSSSLAPVDMAVLPDTGGTAAPDLVVLGVTPDVSGVVARIKDASSGLWLRDLNFSQLYHPLGLTIVPTYGGSPAVEIAALSVHETSGRVLARVKDAMSGEKIRDVYYSSSYVPATLLSIADFADTLAPELGVVGVHYASERVLTRSKDASSRSTVSEVVYSANYPPDAVVVIPDVADSPAQEIVVLGEHPVNGTTLIRVKDASTGALIATIPVP